MRASLALAYRNHKLLFQIRPDEFPEGYLTDTELALWAKFLPTIAAKKK